MSLVIHTNKIIKTDELSTERITTDEHESSSEIQTGVIAFWKFNDNGDDEGGKYDLSDDNNTAFDAEAMFDKSLHTDATSDYRKVAGTEDFRFKATDTFTFEFWLKLDALSGLGYILGRAQTSNLGYSIFMSFPEKEFNIIMVTDNNDRLAYFSADNAISTDWKHFVVTYDGLNTETSIKLYINGVLDIPNVSTKTGTGAEGMELDATDKFTVGAVRITSAYFYIDNLIIYDRVLSISEAVAQYNGGTGIDSYASVNKPSYGIDSNGVLTAEKIYVKNMGLLNGNDVHITAHGELVQDVSTIANKANIRDLDEDDVSWINEVELKKYNIRKNEEECYPDEVSGIIAEDLEKIKSGKRHCFYNLDGDLQSIKYSGMIPDMIAYMKKLKERINKLKK